MSCPENDRDGQVEQEQVQGQTPAGHVQVVFPKIFRKQHVKLTGQQEGSAKGKEDQGAPLGAAHGLIQFPDGFGMFGQPLVQSLRPGKHAKQGKQADAEQGQELDQGLEGHGHDQPPVFLTR